MGEAAWCHMGSGWHGTAVLVQEQVSCGGLGAWGSMARWRSGPWSTALDYDGGGELGGWAKASTSRGYGGDDGG